MKTIEEILKEARRKFLWTVYPIEIAAPGSTPDTYFNKDVEPSTLIDFIKEALETIQKQTREETIQEVAEMDHFKLCQGCSCDAKKAIQALTKEEE